MNEYAEIQALRLALAYDDGNLDALAQALVDVVDGCRACAAGCIVALLAMLSRRVNRDTFDRELTTIMWMERLAQLLPGENAADVADLCAQLNISDEVEFFGDWMGE
jgi:hypothetical protein